MATIKQIDAKIKLVVTTGAKFNTLVHETAVMIAEHAKEHGDCTRAQSLMNAMPKSARRQMLALWFHTYTPIVVKTNDAAWNAKMHKEGTKLYVPFDIESGKATAWFELAEANPEDKVYSLEDLINMVRRVSKQIDKKLDEGKIDPSEIETAKALSERISKLRITHVDVPTANDDEIGNEPVVRDGTNN